jgi:methylmalonyl-CoA epimerase
MNLPKLGRLNHIAVLVRDLATAVERYEAFGGKLIETEHLPASGADVAVVEVGDAHLEFLSTKQPDSRLGKLLAQHGEGIHHLSFQVTDLDAALVKLRGAGIRLRDEVPRPGLHGRRIAFLDPADTCGILIELVEESKSKH